MTLAVILLILRIIGALLLLSLLGTIAWLLYKDLQVSRALLQSQSRHLGYLRVIQDDSGQIPVGTLYTLAPVTSIGRSPGNVIVLDDGYISGEHTLISRRQGKWWVEDLQSRNGTLLNGHLLTETAVLTTGDIIQVGGIQLRLELP